MPPDGRAAPVWARKTVATESCPRSYITAESEGLVEDFLVRRRLGGMNFGKLSARQVEGFLILEQALTAELRGETRGGVHHGLQAGS